MRQFEQLLENYHNQISSEVVKEADANSTISGLFRSLTQSARGGRPLSNANFSPENSYYLFGGAKALPKLHEILKIAEIEKKYTIPTPVKEASVPMPVPAAPESSPNPATPGSQPISAKSTTTTPVMPNDNKQDELPLLFDNQGRIIDEDRFAIRLYNAFDESIESGRNDIKIGEIIAGRIRSGDKGFISKIGEVPNVPKDKAHQSIMNFIQRHGLGSIIGYLKPEQVAQADKGGAFKQMGKAIDTGIISTAKSAAQGLGKYATTGQVNYL